MGLLPYTHRVRERRAGATGSGGRLSRRQQGDEGWGCLVVLIIVVALAIVDWFRQHPLATRARGMEILGSSSGYEGKKKAGASLEAPASCSGGYSARARGALGTLRIPLRVLREGPLLGSHADQS